MTTTSTFARSIECAGVFNLRDLGGYMGHDGRSVRWRTLFRADGLHRVSARADHVPDLGWRTVVDLRTVAEVTAGQYSRDGVDVVHLPLLRETWDASALTADEHNPAEFLAARYLDMTEQGAAAIAAAFDIIASPSRVPAVFHCSAGKDRTGVLGSLILSALGVTDEDIADDYHLSAAAMAPLVEWITSHRPEVAEHMARQPSVFWSCPREAILLFLSHLRDRHGAVELYLAEIGIDRHALAAVRDTLLDG